MDLIFFPWLVPLRPWIRTGLLAVLIAVLAGSLASGPGLGTPGRQPVHGNPRAVAPGATGTASGPGAQVVPRPPGGSLGVTTRVLNARDFGAVGDGKTDNWPALQAAIDAAQSSGANLFIPSGTYLVSHRLSVKGARPIVLSGAGADATVLRTARAQQELLSLGTDGTIVQDLGLDTATSNGGYAIGVNANHTVLRRSHVRGGSTMFALFYAGPVGATPDRPIYNSGNEVLDSTIEDAIGDDGFSFSYQQDALIQNIQHTGSRLSLYIDRNVTVANYTYHPGTQPKGRNGYWVTAPAQGITIQDFVSYGEAGIITANGKYYAQNIVVRREQVLDPHAKLLWIGNAHGVLIDDCHFAGSGGLRFAPVGTADGIEVRGSTVPVVHFQHLPSSSLSLALNNVTFPAFDPVTYQPRQTFVDYSNGPAYVAINGGTWQNAAGGFSYGSGAVYTVNRLAGYRGTVIHS